MSTVESTLITNKESISNIDCEVQERLRRLPVFDIDALLDNLDNCNASYVDYGARSIVFRLKDSYFHDDMTLKLFLAENDEMGRDLLALSRASGYEGAPDDFRFNVFYATNRPDQELIDLQLLGHLKGNIVSPELINSPVCVWSRLTDAGISENVGYSLPFVEGEAVKIADVPDLVEEARNLDLLHEIYVGAQIGSRNAVINSKTGEQKFIDVRVQSLLD